MAQECSFLSVFFVLIFLKKKFQLQHIKIIEKHKKKKKKNLKIFQAKYTIKILLNTVPNIKTFIKNIYVQLIPLKKIF